MDTTFLPFPTLFRIHTLGAAAALLFALPCARAQMGAPSHAASRTTFNDLLEEYAQPAWKEPGWAYGPKKGDAASQLAYAQSLEAAGDLSAACTEYDALVREWHASPEAPAAQMALARLMDDRNKKARAFKEYQYALLMFPNAIPYEDTVRRQMALLRAMEGELGTGFLGMGATMDADDIARLYQIVADNAPASDLAPECLFRMGELYSGEHCGKYDLSLEPYENVLARYPQSVWAPVAAYRAARARVLLARKYPRDEKRTRSALLSIDTVLRFHVQRLSDPAAAKEELLAWREEVDGRLSHAEFQQAEFYDTIRRKPTAAAAAYRRFLELHPNAPDAPRARERLQALESATRE